MDWHMIILGLIMGLNYQVNSQPDFKDMNGDVQRPRAQFQPLNPRKQPRMEFSQLNPGQFQQQQLPQPRLCRNKDVFAVCNMVANPNRPSNINGTLYFMQPVNDDCTYDFLSVQVNIDNVPVNDGTMEHGLHVHQFGDMRDGCESMGPHFNPYNRTHGSPWNPSNARHVGDLGNVMQTPRGNVNTRVVDYLASLLGEDTIIGRGMVLHAGRDDLGLNRDNPESLKTGNAGARLACCVIGVSPPIPRDMFSLYGKR